LPHHAVVVTFDDGYADNFWHAAPLLERYDISATIFVTTGYVGTPRETMSDTLERILLQGETLPSSLTLKIDRETHRWILGNCPSQRVSWDVTLGAYPSPRHRCYYELHCLLRTMNASHRREVLSEVVRWAGCTEEERPERRIMNPDELQTVSRNGLIEMGAHTIWHVMLAQQPVETQLLEIEGCKRQLEHILGHSVTSFAYPYGGANAVNLQTKRCVQQAGFRLACDNVPGTVNRDVDLFALPRCLVRDWDGDEFHRRLQDAFLN
jgi:peptidoglycan/xylan/chitin deacetylase (PgdA/CDA1 family)